MELDHEQCYRAVQARDARFDGVFYTAVTTTGIYCRPSCPAITPKPGNVLFLPTAAAAHERGFRACRRCRPDTTPGSPEWNVRADAVGRAMQMIGDGIIERSGVEGLADRLGYTSRHVNRLLNDELGAGPLAIARSGRAQSARTLIETTTMAMGDIAFAAGFSSIRQFNDSIRLVYAMTPSQMRARGAPAGAGRLNLRLAVREPFLAQNLLAYLGARAIPGVESVDGESYARILTLPHGFGAVRIHVLKDKVWCELELEDLRDTAVAVGRCRRLLDLDADPIAIGESLSADGFLAPLIAAAPGLRLPAQTDGFEVAVRAIVGQQISVARAAKILGHYAEAYGPEVQLSLAIEEGLGHAFPGPERMAVCDPVDLGMPRARGRALVSVAKAVADGSIDLDPGADRRATREALLAVSGIGPWTADYIIMRALADPDILLETDLVIGRVLKHAGITAEQSARWAPWRSYAAMHLWRASKDILDVQHD